MVETPEHARIVLAEDEPTTRELLQRQLEKAGHEVVVAANGRQALEAMTRLGSGIMVADWDMPEMDGLELCRACRELSEMEALGIVYFILLTANADRTKTIAAFEAGADDFLTKPYDPEELLARIRAGERILRLQADLIRGQIEVHKSNAQMAILNRKLEKLANTDALTGLNNRRNVIDRTHEAWALSERNGKPISCIMLDIDRFKKINDTYGHKAGDVVLIEAAAIISHHTRLYDICGRFGGEEFLTVCPETDLAGAAVLAERVRSAIAGAVVRVGEIEVQATISIGVAQRHPRHQSPEEVIAEADRMLYLAKENGRNQVWAADANGNGSRLSQGSPAEFTAQPTA